MITEERCERCKHHIINGPDMACRFNPPTVTAVVVVDKLPDGQLTYRQIASVSNFPTVLPDWKCGQFKVGMLN